MGNRRRPPPPRRRPQPRLMSDPWKAHGLTAGQYHWCLEWLANGYNASDAYRRAYPKASKGTARVQGSRYLTIPAIRRFLGDCLTTYWRAVQMDGEEAAARVARDARIDLRAFFSDQGDFLEPQDWPDEIAGSVKALSQGKHGPKLTLVDPLAARRTILELTGKVHTPESAIAALARALLHDTGRTLESFDADPTANGAGTRITLPRRRRKEI